MGFGIVYACFVLWNIAQKGTASSGTGSLEIGVWL